MRYAIALIVALFIAFAPPQNYKPINCEELPLFYMEVYEIPPGEGPEEPGLRFNYEVYYDEGDISADSVIIAIDDYVLWYRDAKKM